MYRKTLALVALIAVSWAFLPQHADACHRRKGKGEVVAAAYVETPAYAPSYGGGYGYGGPSYGTMPYSTGYATPGYGYGAPYNSVGVGVGIGGYGDGYGRGGYEGYGRGGFEGGRGGFEGGRGGMYPHR